MFKAVTYDRPVAMRKRREKYRAEIDAVHEFNASEHVNMLFEYDSKGAAHNACQVMKRYIENARMPLDVKIRDEFFVVIEKRAKEEGSATVGAAAEPI